MKTSDRGSYIQGLRQLSEAIADNPSLPLPHSLSGDELLWYIHDDIETVLTIRALISDAVTAPYDSNNFPVQVNGTLAGFPVSVLIAREIALDGAPASPPQPMNPRLLADPVPS